MRERERESSREGREERPILKGGHLISLSIEWCKLINMETRFVALLELSMSCACWESLGGEPGIAYHKVVCSFLLNFLKEMYQSTSLGWEGKRLFQMRII